MAFSSFLGSLVTSNTGSGGGALGEIPVVKGFLGSLSSNISAVLKGGFSCWGGSYDTAKASSDIVKYHKPFLRKLSFVLSNSKDLREINQFLKDFYMSTSSAKHIMLYRWKSKCSRKGYEMINKVYQSQKTVVDSLISDLGSKVVWRNRENRDFKRYDGYVMEGRNGERGLRGRELQYPVITSLPKPVVTKPVVTKPVDVVDEEGVVELDEAEIVVKAKSSFSVWYFLIPVFILGLYYLKDKK